MSNIIIIGGSIEGLILSILSSQEHNVTLIDIHPEIGFPCTIPGWVEKIDILQNYLSDDEKYGEFWKLIYDEYVLTNKLILELTGFAELMQNEDAGKASILVREEIVQPLITIQQYALMNINKANEMSLTRTDIKTFEKMVIRSMYGNINASRNSA